MERSVTATGIGGQGIQLAAQVLARAAIADDRTVMLFGSYGGMMRGGNTDASMVIGTGPIDSPPVLSHSWLGLVMHHDYMAATCATLDDRSVAFVNTSVLEPAAVKTVAATGAHVVEVPATDIALERADLVCASMVMLATACEATGLIDAHALLAGLDESLPPYRRNHLATNQDALAAGAEAGRTLHAPSAWEVVR